MTSHSLQILNSNPITGGTRIRKCTCVGINYPEGQEFCGGNKSVRGTNWAGGEIGTVRMVDVACMDSPEEDYKEYNPKSPKCKDGMYGYDEETDSGWKCEKNK